MEHKGRKREDNRPTSSSTRNKWQHKQPSCTSTHSMHTCVIRFHARVVDAVVAKIGSACRLQEDRKRIQSTSTRWHNTFALPVTWPHEEMLAKLAFEPTYEQMEYVALHTYPLGPTGGGGAGGEGGGGGGEGGGGGGEGGGGGGPGGGG